MQTAALQYDPAVQPTVVVEHVPPTAVARVRPPFAAVPAIAAAVLAKRLVATKKPVDTGVEKYPDGTGIHKRLLQNDPAQLKNS